MSFTLRSEENRFFIRFYKPIKALLERLIIGISQVIGEPFQERFKIIPSERHGVNELIKKVRIKTLV